MANKFRRVFFLTKEEEIKELEKFIEENYNKYIKDRKNVKLVLSSDGVFLETAALVHIMLMVVV